MRTRAWSWMGLLTAVAIMPLPAWGQLAVGMNPSRTSGTAPLYVFFDGTPDAGVSHTDPDIVEFRDLLCEWDFGDTASGTWSNTGKSKNTAIGCIGAHVYESTGTYKATLRVSDEAGNTKSVSMDINVISPDVTWSGTNTVCFENGGGFQGCPAGARQISTGNYEDALASGCGVDGKNAVRRCLFRRGDRFTTRGTTQLWDGPMLIGAFGSGPRPIIDGSASSGNSVHVLGHQSPAHTAGDIRIVGLDYIGLAGNQGPGYPLVNCGSNAPGGIDDLLLMDLNISSFSALLACSSSGDPQEVTDKIALVSNTIHNPDHRSLGFIHATRAAIMNNTSTDSGMASSQIRISFGRKFLIEHNNLTGLTGNATFKLAGNKAVATGIEVPDINQQRYWLISDNHMECSSGGDCFGGYNDPTLGTNGAHLDQAVFERNSFNIPEGSRSRIADSCFAVSAWRNNVAIAGSQPGNPFLQMSDAADDCKYPRDQLRVYNNTFYATGSSPRTAIQFRTGNNDSIVRNNLYYTPGDVDTDRIFSNGGTGNVATSNVQTNVDIFQNQGAIDEASDLRLDPNAAQAGLAIDGGFDLNAITNDGEVVFVDFAGKCLANNNVASRRDIGAFETGGVDCALVNSGAAVPAIPAPNFLP